MTLQTRSALVTTANAITAETSVHALTPAVIGGFLRNLVDSSILQNEATTPPTAGDGLTGTSVFSVLPNGGTLSVSASGVKIADISGPAILGRAAVGSGAVSAIAGSADQVLRVNGAGTDLSFGSIATGGITDAAVTLAKLADLSGLSVVGRAANSTGAVAAITAGSDGQILRRSGTTLGFGTIVNAGVDNAAAIAGTKISPDFGSQNIQSTGYLQLGSTVSTTGNVRGGATFQLAGWSTSLSANASLVAFDDSTHLITYGTGNTAGISGFIQLGGSSAPVLIKAGTNNGLLFTTAASLINQGSAGNARYSFSTSVTAPMVTHETTSSVNATGAPMIIQAQSCNNGTTVGGALSLLGGTGTTGGSVCLCKADGTKRVEVNDTGIGFFATTPVSKRTLTDNTTGAAATQLVDVGAVFSQANINNNFASIRQLINQYGLC